jgi:type I restriction enzyme, S subunit
MGDKMGRNLRIPPSVKPGIPKLGVKPKGWREVAFKDILEVVVRPAEVKPNQRYQLINAKRNRGGIVPRASLLGMQIKTTTQFIAAANDFVISRRQIVHGACGIVPPELDGALVSNEYSTLVPKDGLLLPYLGYYAHTVHFQQTCFNSSVGVAIEKMVFNLDHWLRHRLYLPPIDYQREVVDVLATADRAIAGVEKLIAAKRTLKKGLAQQLLTGQRRLPGFNKPWGAKRLGNLVTLHFSGIDKKTHADEVPVRLCNYTDVYYNDGITSDMDFMQATASKSEIDSFSLKQWDVVITKDSETPDDIGKPAVIMHDLPGVVCGYHLAILRPKNVNGLFLAQLLRLPRIRYELYRIANGVTRFGLGQSALRHLELTVPNQSEQARIAFVLGAADQEIALLEKKLAALCELKKGLMQKLLSGSDRVSTSGHDHLRDIRKKV